MIKTGVFPAAVTPYDAKGRIDPESIAKLLAHFESAGCAGAVLAGTNGEGPSLSAPEKRDLLQVAKSVSGELQLILGIATPSLDEAIWLARRASEIGADGILLMPPYYFRAAPIEGIEAWFRAVLDAAEVPTLLYNFPKATGFALSPEMLGRLAEHKQFAGCKDSSGDASNISAYRWTIPSEKRLFVGDETLLEAAQHAGWSGTISGVANVICHWLCAVERDYASGDLESSMAKFAVALPAIKLLRGNSQPSLNKAILARNGIIERASVRLPLFDFDPAAVDTVIEDLAKSIGPLPKA